MIVQGVRDAFGQLPPGVSLETLGDAEEVERIKSGIVAGAHFETPLMPVIASQSFGLEFLKVARFWRRAPPGLQATDRSFLALAQHHGFKDGASALIAIVMQPAGI